ncbi:MAG: hypothetical protein AAF674_17660 [Pseudomonadota bacterium]
MSADFRFRLFDWLARPVVFLALALLLAVEKQVLAVISTAGGQDITETTFAFGEYIEGLIERGTYSSCVGDSCEYASRMPLLPLILATLSVFSREMVVVTMLKCGLWSALSVAGVFLVRRYAGRWASIVTLSASLGLIFIITSPSLAKHVSVLHYEEAFLIEMLLVWWLCLMVLMASVWERDSTVTKAPLAGLLILLGVLMFLLKETMISLMVVSLTGGLLIWLREGRALWRASFTVMVMSGAVLFGAWVTYNSSVTDRFAVFTSWNGENRYQSANPYTASIYPDIVPDVIFYDVTEAVLEDGTVIAIPRLKRRREFASETEWDAHYRQEAATWIANNPEAWWAYREKTTRNFFLSIERTPVSIQPVFTLRQDRTQRLFDELVGAWLVWGRVIQFAFAGLVVFLLIAGPWPTRFTAIGAFLTAMAYAAPYIYGLNYERHIVPFLFVITLASVFLVGERLQARRR